MRVTKGRPAKTQALDNRRVILDRATALFAERGFDGVSIREIAAASAIHLSTLYHYFPQKSALYSAVVTEAIGHASTLFVEALAGNDDPLLALTRFFEGILEVWATGSPHARIIDRVLLDGSLDLLPLEIFDQARSVLAQFAATIIGRSLDEAALSDFAEIVLGICYGVAKFRPMNQLAIRGGAPLSPPGELAAFMAAWLTKDLRAAVARKAAVAPAPLPRGRRGDRAPPDHRGGLSRRG